MNINGILAELRAERDRIDRAIAAIEGLNSTGRRRGRPPGSTTAPKKLGRRRHMSAAGRKRISQATKKRWALWRKRRAKAA